MTRKELIQSPEYWKGLYENECEVLGIPPVLHFTKSIDEDELADIALGAAIELDKEIDNTMTTDQELWYQEGFIACYRAIIAREEGEENGFSISCTVEPTEENQAAINKLIEDCRQAEDEQRRRIVGMLRESARQQVDYYIAQGAGISDTDTFTDILYNAMTEGWNRCYKIHKDKIENR